MMDTALVTIAGREPELSPQWHFVLRAEETMSAGHSLQLADWVTGWNLPAGQAAQCLSAAVRTSPVPARYWPAAHGMQYFQTLWIHPPLLTYVPGEHVPLN
jgi:hypothetical protein